MESIDINLSDLEPVSINLNDSKPSVNFGPGIELLMNEKVKSNNGPTTVDLGEIDSLEAELNELSGATNNSSSDTKTFAGFASNLFGFGSTKKEEKPINIKFSDDRNDSNLGQATLDSIGNPKTWDGFSKTNEIPIKDINSGNRLSEREKRRRKRAMIKKLEEWKDKGHIKNASHFTLDSNYEEVEDEYETALEDKRKKDSIKLQGWWFITFVNSVEYANTVFNPFDLNLDGWGEQISEDIDSYEEIFSELHEKYKGGKLSPELSLLLRLGFSAAVVNFTNKALSTATPGFNDVIRQSPELMRMFSQATVESMKQNSPGFSFAENIMNPNMGPPPAPVKTRNEQPPPPSARPGMQFTSNAVSYQVPSNRPDLNIGRGGPEPIERQEKSIRPTTTPYRPEMQGPKSTDIDNILSGLKTKTVNIHDNSTPVNISTPPPNNNRNISIQQTEDDSLISISSLKDLQNTTMPRRTNRRGRNISDKNTISLDI